MHSADAAETRASVEPFPAAGAMPADKVPEGAKHPVGELAFVIELGTAGHFSLFTSDAAREEAERNLAAKYPDTLPLLAALPERITLVTADLSPPFPDGLPPKDVVIFQAAVTCGASHFLTGDLNHFGPFMNQPDTTCSILVQTVAEFLAAL